MVNECTKVQNPWCHDFMHASITQEKAYMNTGNKRSAFYTPSIYSVYALRKSVLTVCKSVLGTIEKRTSRIHIAFSLCYVIVSSYHKLQKFTNIAW